MSLSTVDAFKHIRSGELVTLDTEQLQQLQAVLTGILDDIVSVCDRCGLVYVLGGGSALGAYRHHGFIPWDDDIDINMPRADYDRFIPEFRKEFGDKYWIHTPQDTHNYGLMLSRILLKGTSVKTREDFQNSECGAFVDLFIIENTYDSRFLRALHGFGCMAYGFLVSCRKFYRDREPLMRLACSTGDRSLQRKFRTKIVFGALLSWRSLDGLVKDGDRWNRRCRNGRSKYVSIPTGRRVFWGELYERSEICDTVELPYCGRMRKCPAAIEQYLTRLFGDYNRIPPVEERESHAFFRPFSLGDAAGKDLTGTTEPQGGGGKTD
ncbi:MAG: LicD family protein [Lachnospiraceae bacterium]|jgi:lipopolysaccharide cholinephosphotransferase|nr:LicD family protein [Lachnospiraceae bacterium]